MKTLKLFALTCILVLNACSRPDGIIDPVNSTETTGTQEPASVGGDTPATIAYEPVKVDNVEVEIGQGSPIPVHVHVSGMLPDTCAQVEYAEQVQDGPKFIINVGTISSGEEICVKEELPFRMSIPLNVSDLPVGSYTVEVNGSSADFSLDAGSSTTSLRTADMPIVKQDILVDDLTVEVGVGSPIPVHTIVSGNLPTACAQLGEIQLYRASRTFFVRLVAYLPAQTDCRQDRIPFRLTIPLNLVNLADGTYEVIVNGRTTTFDIPVQ